MKKRQLLPFLAFIFVHTALVAQKEVVEVLKARVGPDTGKWTNSLELGINFNQSSFSPNWKGGGTNSYAIGGILNINTQYEKRRFAYSGKLSNQYGLQKQQNQELRKTIDVLLGDFKFAYLISKNWSGYLGANLITQFTPGYEYDNDTLYVERQSNLFAPAYLTVPLGIEYKPNNVFFARFGLASLRYTFVSDKEIRKTVANNYGVDTNKTVLRQFGMQIIAGYNKNITQTINLKANYFGFADYARPNLEDFVHRFDITFTAKVTKYINTTFSSILFYDLSQDKDVQVSQVLTVGFLMQLGKKN